MALRPRLTFSQKNFLLYAARENAGPTATHWFNAKLEGGPRITSRSRSVLQHLAKLGLMEGVSADNFAIRWWKITPQGKAVAEQLKSEGKIDA